MFYRGCGNCGERWAIGMVSTCKCPKREWVGLTKDEIEEIANWADNNSAPWYLGYAYAIEQKLKEKNGGTST